MKRTAWTLKAVAAGAISATLVAVTLLSAGSPAWAQEAKPLKLGVVTFLSGGGAGPFGIPARNAAELMIEAVNAGTLPAPYTGKGFAGATIEPIIVDENGPATKVVQDFRNLVDRQNADAVVGYVSSGSCLAVAPVAEELKTLLMMFDCGTPRIFEEGSYKYVFRSSAHATIDSVAAALYLKAKYPNLHQYGGINQQYAWGQDSWRDFTAAMQAIDPKAQSVSEQWPKLFAGQYSAEISEILLKKPQILHSSLWGGDLESFFFQATARSVEKSTLLVMTAAETAMFRLGQKMPDGIVIGGRGPYGLLANPSPANDWFRKAYYDRYTTPAIYSTYHMANAILALKFGYDKAAAANGGKFPSKDQVIAALEHLEFDGMGTHIKFALGKGHQAVTGHAYGTYKFDRATGEPTITNIVHFPAECVNPPEGISSADWIKGGMKGAKCK